MASKNRLAIDPVSTKDFSTITASYSVMDDNTPTAHASALTLIQNFTDVAVMVSIDGVNDHIPLSSNGFLLLDLDKFIIDKQLSLPVGTAFYAKQIGGTAATAGKLYITTFYPSD